MDIAALPIRYTGFTWFFLLVMITGCGDSEIQEPTELSVADALTSDTSGYLRVEGPREFDFPSDHGPHPDYKTEWWYVTGNLNGDDGAAFGYQFTVFRIALLPPRERRQQENEGWRSNQLYMGHFGLSDINQQRHIYGERFSRGAAGLAGAQAFPFRVWVEDWEAEAPEGAEPFPMRIRAKEEGAEINLTVSPVKPRVYQGNRGYSQKGPRPGDASHYFSYTRLRTEGWIAVDGDTSSVEGLSWMDREWSTSALGEGQVGWDWFSLQLDNDHEVMFYHIREKDGRTSRYSKGLIAYPDGTTAVIDWEDVQVVVHDRWESPLGGTYPVSWTLDIPSKNLSLGIVAAFPDQEMATSVRYWEGAVHISGTHDGTTVQGRGFVEMTGYGDQRTFPR